MSRAPSAAALATAALLLVLPGCSSNSSYIPPGSYAGSTKAGREITLEVGGDVKLNGAKLKQDPARKRFVNEARQLAIACTVQRPSKDLTCDLTTNGVTERLELMRL